MFMDSLRIYVGFILLVELSYFIDSSLFLINYEKLKNNWISKRNPV